MQTQNTELSEAFRDLYLAAPDLHSLRCSLVKWEIENRNLGNRCMKPGFGQHEHCRYQPTKTSPGCAIGRLVKPDLARRLDKLGPAGDLGEALPPEIASLGQSFLAHLQRLHDTKAFWTSEGFNHNWRDEELLEPDYNAAEELLENYL